MELHTYLGVPVSQDKEDSMAKKARKSARGRKQDRARAGDRITKFGTRRR